MSNETDKKKWYSIQEAADYLDIGEPTIYRWMRERKITFRKVGDSTRFFKEDLDEVMQVFPSEKGVEQVKTLCPLCHSDDLVAGTVQATGGNYFRPAKTKFWTLRDANIETEARMCAHCGAIIWFGNLPKLEALRLENKKASEQTG